MMARNMSWDGKDCLKNCKKTVVAFLAVELSNTYLNVMKILQLDGATMILFAANGFDDPVVEESLKVELTGLFANLGGNLSLWLRGSFIALLHIFVFPMRIWLCGKANSTEENGGPFVSGLPPRRRISHWEKKFDYIDFSDLKAFVKGKKTKAEHSDEA